MMEAEYLLTAAITALVGVVARLWKLNLKKDEEIKALMREMIDLAGEIREHLQNGRKPSSTQ